MSPTPETVDDYLAGFPDDIRPVLAEVAAAIRRALPGAEERIRYGMPAFMFPGRSYGLHFAGWKKHVGLYPVATLDPGLETEVAPHRAAKDTVRFFYRDGVPYDLVERIAAGLAVHHRDHG
ncbi:iron chaperone [Nocardioides aestuarii]|uniref:Iron chaperone n=1 Tax=Nocardioides aestuarii TaxID=252231 RepID=A0ABW4TIA6_9ACTN